jgi:hypothetical protein
MATNEQDPGASDRTVPKGEAPTLRVEGRAALEGGQEYPKDIQLKAYVFDRAGQTLGAADLGPDGTFSVPLTVARAGDVEVVIGPSDDPQTIRKSAAFSQKFAAADWREKTTLKADLVLPRDIVSIWWPAWICVTGHVRKTFQQNGVTQTCPVPFVKVEIFDVDREDCWWPYLNRWWDRVIDQTVIRVPELLKARPIVKPFPWPDPGPDPRALIGDVSGLDAVALNPQPLPPGPDPSAAFASTQAFTAFSAASASAPAASIRSASPLLARLDKLTLTSRLAPWVLFPGCFYSRQLVCETTTDNCGYFRCCFRWWPFHFRRGRFRFDSRPDIIVKVTQVIDGVETVIYLDPYSSTRWNVSSAHIDLYVDNDDVRCGSCDDQTRPEGAAVFLTRIGNDEVYRINQASGTYSSPGFPPTTNMAYGDWLRVYAQFGTVLSRALPIAGAAAPYFYRLSRSGDGVNFTAITTELSDTRVSQLTLFSETHTLGPQTVNGVPGLYEVRDFANYYWYNPDWIGHWNTVETESDSATYILRLEVFDSNGVKLDSTQVDYRDGTVAPPAVLPPMLNRCDLRITIDNKPPVVGLSIPAVINSCGVVPWGAAGGLSFDVSVTQENGRLHSWQLEYTKGVLPGVHWLASGSSNNGAPAAVNQNVSGAPLLVGVTTTCAFALKLYAWAHIRNGYGLIYYRETIKAIAIEKCS